MPRRLQCTQTTTMRNEKSGFDHSFRRSEQPEEGSPSSLHECSTQVDVSGVRCGRDASREAGRPEKMRRSTGKRTFDNLAQLAGSCKEKGENPIAAIGTKRKRWWYGGYMTAVTTLKKKAKSRS